MIKFSLGFLFFVLAFTYIFKYQYAKIPPMDMILSSYPDARRNLVNSQSNLNEQLTITVWNIYKAQKKGLMEDIAKLRESCDVLLLQEAYTKNVENPQAGLSEYVRSKENQIDNPTFAVVMASSFHYKFPWAKGHATGVATLYNQQKLPLYKDPITLRTNDTELITDTPKVVLFTHHRLAGGTEILFVNVHAINFVHTQAFIRQMDSVKEYIQGFIKSTSEGIKPVILGGDFNTWSKMRTDYLHKVADDIGLVPVHLSHPVKIKTFVQWPLDHIFTSHVVVIDGRTLNDVKSSDHTPIQIKISLA